MPRDLRRPQAGCCRVAIRTSGRTLLGLLWLATVWAGCMAGPVFAVEPLPTTELDEPRFRLESLEVVGQQRVTDEILLAESLLVPGKAYREVELRDAVFRLRRLPFVLDASFRLERGTERGLYRLVITIDEVRPFFFGENLQITRFGGQHDVALGNIFAGSDSLSLAPLAGVRFFLGRHHEVFGSVAIDRGIQLGYNRYDLFGRRAVLSVGLTHQTCCPSQVFPLGLDPTFTTWEESDRFTEAQVALGIPLQGTRHVRIAAAYQTSEDGFRRAVLGESFNRRSLPYRDLRLASLEVVWSDDSTDDPIFPSRGRRLTVTLDIQRMDAELSAPASVFPSDDVIHLPDGVALGDRLPTSRSEQLRVAVTDSRHWSFGRRHTVSLFGRLAVGTARTDGLARLDEDCTNVVAGYCAADLVLLGDDRFELWEASLRLRHAVRIGSDRFRREYGDLRFETAVEIGWDDNASDLGLNGDPLSRRSAGVGLVFRNRWGLYRAGFSIVDYGGGV